MSNEIENLDLSYCLVKLDKVTLFAHGDYYDFLRMYDENKKEWVISKITFSMLIHDFQMEEINEAKAKEITNDNLPTNEYQKYYDLLNNK